MPSILKNASPHKLHPSNEPDQTGISQAQRAVIPQPGSKRVHERRSGFNFTVLASTNASLPLLLWSNLGPAMESPAGSGQFHFTDPQASGNPQRFYRVRSP